MSSINPIKHSFNTTLTAIENNPKKTAIIAASVGTALAGAGAAVLLTVSTISGIALAALAGVALLFAAYQAIKAIKLNKQVVVLNSNTNETTNNKKPCYRPIPPKELVVEARLQRKEEKRAIKENAQLKKEQATKAAKTAEVDKAAGDALANARKNTAGEPTVDVQELSIPNFNWKDVTAAAAKDVAKVAAATIAVAGLGYAAYAYGPAAIPVVKTAVANTVASTQAAIPVVKTAVANALVSAKAATSVAVAKTLAYANSYAVPVMIRA